MNCPTCNHLMARWLAKPEYGDERTIYRCAQCGTLINNEEVHLPEVVKLCKGTPGDSPLDWLTALCADVREMLTHSKSGPDEEDDTAWILDYEIEDLPALYEAVRETEVIAHRLKQLTGGPAVPEPPQPVDGYDDSRIPF